MHWGGRTSACRGVAFVRTICRLYCCFSLSNDTKNRREDLHVIVCPLMWLGLTILKFSYLLVRHRKWLCTRLNKVTLCFCVGGSRPSLKVREVKCVPGDPAVTCPVLFKGSRSRLSLALALRSLLYVASLSRKAVLSVLLAVLCYACGYGIVCSSSGLCGSIFIYYRRALRVYGCMRSLRV